VLHLKADELLDMLIAVYCSFDMEEDAAGVIQIEYLFATSHFSGHGQKMQFFAVLDQD